MNGKGLAKQQYLSISGPRYLSNMALCSAFEDFYGIVTVIAPNRNNKILSSDSNNVGRFTIILVAIWVKCLRSGQIQGYSWVTFFFSSRKTIQMI
jgi:hypothetical protein